MKDFDKDFLYECLKNDLANKEFDVTKPIKIVDNISLDIKNKTIDGEAMLTFSKEDLDNPVCNVVGGIEFCLLVRYGLLGYSCFVKNENEFILTISELKEGFSILEDITVKEIFADELDFYFHDSILRSKESFSSFGDFKSVVSSLFAISTLPKGKNKTYSFFATGLELTKENLMKLKDSNDQVPSVDHITFIDCVGDFEFAKSFFEKSTVVDFK